MYKPTIFEIILLLAGIISLVIGIAINQYWFMLLGLLGIAYSVLEWTGHWK